MLKYSFTPHDLSPADVHLYHEYFKYDLFLDPVLRDEAYNELKTYFNASPMSERKKYKTTFWAWYVRLTWEKIYTLSKAEFVKTFEEQLVSAIVLGEKVQNVLLQYLVLNEGAFGEEMLLYEEIRNAIFNSKFEVGMYKGVGFTLSEIVKKIQYFETNKTDSLVVAEYNGRLKNIIGDTWRDCPLAYEEPERAASFFLSFIYFLIATRPEDIPGMLFAYKNRMHNLVLLKNGSLVVETYVQNPDDIETIFKQTNDGLVEVEDYSETIFADYFRQKQAKESGSDLEEERALALESGVEENGEDMEKNSSVYENSEEQNNPDEQFSESNNLENESNTEEMQEQEQEQEIPSLLLSDPSLILDPELLRSDLSVDTLRQYAFDHFETDENDDFVDDESVIVWLNALADKTGNNDIRSYYYFDEGAQKCVWKNEALIRD